MSAGVFCIEKISFNVYLIVHTSLVAQLFKKIIRGSLKGAEPRKQLTGIETVKILTDISNYTVLNLLFFFYGNCYVVILTVLYNYYSLLLLG